MTVAAALRHLFNPVKLRALYREGGSDLVRLGALPISTGPPIALERRGTISVLRVDHDHRPIVLRHDHPRAKHVYGFSRFTLDEAIRLADLLNSARSKPSSRRKREIGVVSKRSSLRTRDKTTVIANHRRAPIRILNRGRRFRVIKLEFWTYALDLNAVNADQLIDHLEAAIAEHRR